MCIIMALRGKPVLTKPFGCVGSNIYMCCCWSCRCLCLVAVLSQGIAQGAHHDCESFILIQMLYLVGVLLMTFDLLTCGRSQGNGFLPVYILSTFCYNQ